MKASDFRRLLPGVGLVYGCLCKSSIGAAADEISRLRSIYAAETGKVEASYSAQLTNAPAQYQWSLDVLEKTCQQKGDFKGVIAVRSEKARFDRERGTPGMSTEGEPAELETLRAKLQALPAELSDQRRKQIATLSATYLGRLEALQRDLTRQGQIGLATEIQTDIDKARAQLDTRVPDVTPTASDGTSALVPVQTQREPEIRAPSAQLVPSFHLSRQSSGKKVKVPGDVKLGYVIGSVSQGDTLTVQYVSGGWYGDHTPLTSPDGSDKVRCLVVAKVGQDYGPLIPVPQGTRDNPFEYTFDTSFESIGLRLAGSYPGNTGGEVIYAISVKKAVSPGGNLGAGQTRRTALVSPAVRSTPTLTQSNRQPSGKTVRVPGNLAVGCVIGPVAQGETMTIQYVSGMWYKNQTPLTSPDDSDKVRCMVVAKVGEEFGPLVPVPQDTRETPFEYLFDTACESVGLRLEGSYPGNTGGEVIYMISMKKAASPGDSLLGSVQASHATPVSTAAGVRVVSVRADSQEGTSIGRVAEGTRISIQYDSGHWTFGKGVQPDRSPDDPDADNRYRLMLSGRTGPTSKTEIVPPSTKGHPFEYVFMGPFDEVFLRIADPVTDNNEGTVRYRCELTPPSVRLPLRSVSQSINEEVEIPASREVGYLIGPVKKGSTLVLRFLGGGWKSWGRFPSANPDGQTIEREAARMVVAYQSMEGAESRVITAVSSGTATTPFTYVFLRAYDRVLLRINDVDGTYESNPGSVRYSVELKP